MKPTIEECIADLKRKSHGCSDLECLVCEETAEQWRRIEELRGYVRHKDRCSHYGQGDYDDCDCGLRSLLEKP